MHLDDDGKLDFEKYPKCFHGCNPAKLVEILCNGLRVGAASKMGKIGVYLSHNGYTAV